MYPKLIINTIIWTFEGYSKLEIEEIIKKAFYKEECKK
jgi:hypothetical protein